MENFTPAPEETLNNPTINFNKPTLSFKTPEPVPQPTERSLAMPIGDIGTAPQSVPSFSAPANTDTQTSAKIDALLRAGKAAGMSDAAITNTMISQDLLSGEQVENTPQIPSVLSPKDVAQQNYLAAGSENLADVKNQIRLNARLAEKQALSDKLFNEMEQERLAHIDRINKIERNESGKLKSGVNNKINKAQDDHDRRMAWKAVQYNSANGDYQRAQEIVDARISDIETDRQRRMEMWQQAWNFAQNDLTESEKLQAQQNFEQQQAEWDFEKQKEMIEYEDALARSRQAASGSGSASPTQIKEINGQSYEWDATIGQWVPFQGGNTTENNDRTLESLNLTREAVAQIIGTPDADGNLQGGLYSAAGANPTMEFLRRNIGSSVTDKSRLDAYADTISSNMLTMAGDPNIRDFFGPQMSEADVRMMTAAATTLRNTKNLSGEEILTEAKRIDSFLGKYEAAVKARSQPINQSVQYAPDGVPVIIID